MVQEIPAPWLKYYGNVPHHLEYPEIPMSEAVLRAADAEPGYPALSFNGKVTCYGALAQQIDRVARAFHAIAVHPGDRVMICMPNVPQAVVCFYALNRIGAVATMVHPLSAVGEIASYIKETGCEIAITLDQFYGKFMEAIVKTPIRKLIVTRISEALPCLKGLLYRLATERRFPAIKDSETVITWKRFLEGASSVKDNYIVRKDPHTEAVVLFSGGTTGVTKGIKLPDYGFNANATQMTAVSVAPLYHAKMLAAMPVFHGFGLCTCVHLMLFSGGTAILVPRFNVKSYARLVIRHRPNFIAAVPTLFEGLARSSCFDGVDLSCLKGVYCGGDSLTVELKKKIDRFLADHNSPAHIREGYGATECISACCLTPAGSIEKEGSIGLPTPDTYFKICKVGTTDEAPYGSEGEICICGPSVMLGYIGHEEDNANALRTHSDGHVWLHTGDLGVMDEDGFVFFRQRIKRMIITSGYNVYPSQLENILERHEAVEKSCVIGVPDPYKIQKVKAFVELSDGYSDSPELRASIMAHCRRHIAKYALPYTIEVMDSLPTTHVGKIAYTKLS